MRGCLWRANQQFHQLVELAGSFKREKRDLPTIETEAPPVTWKANKSDEIQMELKMDSQSAIQVVERNNFTGRLKRVETRRHCLADEVAKGKIQLMHVPGTKSPADLMTKPVTLPTWKRLVKRPVN